MPTVALDTLYVGAHEAMRFLPAGNYRLTTPAAEQLVVRAIPELHYAYYNAEPKLPETGPFKGAFQEEYVFKNINTLCRNVDAAAKGWHRRGKRWLATENKNRWPREEWSIEDAIYNRLVKHRGFVRPYYSGVVLNEFGDSQSMCAAWAKAVDRILSDPRFRGKGFYPYARDLSNGREGRELVRTIVKHGGAVFCKRYLKEQRTEPAAWRFLRDALVEPAKGYRENCPGALPHLIINFGIMAATLETLDTFAHVDHKTYLDMQFNMAATHPAFEGLGGLMSYSSPYTDEETTRWAMRLFRHYAIEGKATPCTGDPYVLSHIRNGDFEQQGEAWSLRPAERGSIRFSTSPGFGWMQGRYPRTTEGDAVIVTKRREEKPNVFSQKIRNLQPGRYYSFRMFTGDVNDMLKEQKYALSVRLDNVTLLPGKSFINVFEHHRAHWSPPYSEDKRAWMNYHWLVFRAKDETATLTVSDWATDDDPGGPIGQELMFNFIQIQPYFYQKPLPQTPVTPKPQAAPPPTAPTPEPPGLTASWWKVPGKTALAAWRAVGAATLRASYSNLADPGKYTLTARGKAPAWSRKSGWSLDASDAGCLSTGILLPEGCTVIVRIANGRRAGMPVGTHAKDGGDLQIETVSSVVYYRYGNATDSERIAFTDGVLALAGPDAYRNGRKVLSTRGRWSKKGKGASLFIGARNNYEKNGGADCFFSGDILAVAVYADALTEEEIAALTARMNALTVPK